MINKLIGFNHHINNAFSPIQMDVDTLFMMLDRGIKIDDPKLIRVKERLIRCLKEFPIGTTTMLQIADLVQENALTTFTFASGESFKLDTGDKIATVYNWMKNNGKTIEDAMERMS